MSEKTTGGRGARSRYNYVAVFTAHGAKRYQVYDCVSHAYVGPLHYSHGEAEAFIRSLWQDSAHGEGKT